MKSRSVFLIVAAFSGACTAQTISSVAPSSADLGQVLPVTITGGGFTECTQSGHYPLCRPILPNPSLTSGSSSLPAVSLNVPSYQSSPNYANATFNIPASAATGYWSLIAGPAQLANAVLISTARDSLIDSISPTAGNAGKPVTVAINAAHAHFQYVQTESAVNNIGKIELLKGSASIRADSFSITSSTVCKAYFALPITAAVGVWDLKVTQTVGRPTVVLPAGFSLAATAAKPGAPLHSQHAVVVKTRQYKGGFVAEIITPNLRERAIQARLYNAKGSIVRSWNFANCGTTRLTVGKAGLSAGVLMLEVDAGGTATRVPVTIH